MLHSLGSLPRRIVAVLAVLAIGVAGMGIAFDNAEAASSVIPQVGPEGKVVYGAHGGTDKALRTMLFQVDLNGTPSFMFCIDISTTIEFGVSYDETDWAKLSVPNLTKIARILSQTTAIATKDVVEIAAAQAAIWHFSDGFNLNVNDTRNDPAVITRYNVLIADAEANPVNAEPAGTLKVSPATGSAAQGSPIFYDVTTTSTTPLSIELSDTSVSAHPATGDVCDTATTITSITGNGRLCLTSTDPRVNVSMTLRTTAAPVTAGRAFYRPNRQKLIIGKSGEAQSHETVTASWTANAQPTVSIACPTDGVQFGTQQVFTANGSDPDGTSVTYQWSLNDVAIAGATNSTLTTTLKAGDRLTVTVSDPAGLTATAEANCPGHNKPTVSLACPDKAILGDVNSFTATGADPDGDTLTYTWMLNGTALSSTTGPTLSVKISSGDVLSVTATDSSGLTSEAATAGCIPASTNHRPLVTVSCPDNLVYGKPTNFVAIGSDEDGDALTYTWTINGQAVAGATGATAALTTQKGDTIGVRANDGQSDSDIATVSCDGSIPNLPPTVTVNCPTQLIWGEPAIFTASGTDPEGDALTYHWTINGVEQANATSDKLTATINKGDVVAVTVTDPLGASSTPATANCAGNTRPQVTLNCPSTTIMFGEPTKFTAGGFDADGDALSYTWKVNGKVVTGQSSSTTVLTLSKGDEVSVTVTDAGGAASANATVTCAGNIRPTVTVTCPTNMVWGEPFTFIANGSDPDAADGEGLTYTWSINGVVVSGTTGPKLTETLFEGDKLTVTVTDGAGADSSPAAGNCSGSYRPTVAVTCPAKLVFGEPTTFTATGADRDGDTLTYIWAVNGKVIDGQTSASAELTINKGDQVSVTAKDPKGLTSVAATTDCSGTSRPTVKLTCPSLVIWSEPTTFTAVGTDADGDTVSYTWTVNGTVVTDQTGHTLTTTLQPGDKVAVSVTDATGLTSSTVTVDCSGTTKPTVTVNCPANMIFGEPFTFTAVGTDADGDALTYTWTINGVVVAGETGSSITATLNKGDVISVTVSDIHGATSDPANSNCEGNSRPTVVLQCPASLVFGEQTLFTAVGSDADNEQLTYTWFINDTAVSGQTGPTAMLTLNKDDKVSVTATDTHMTVSAVAESGCTGTARPKVTLTCPTAVIYGEPIAFTANGTDADGDTLTYTWKINGSVVDGQTDATAVLTIQKGDKVSVIVTDPMGLSSDEMQLDCSGTARPTVSLTCPDTLVYGEPTAITATGVDADGDLNLAFAWYLNDAPIPGANEATYVATLKSGDVLSVTVTDSTGATSAAVSVSCAGNARPTVALTCPDKIVYDEPIAFTAVGADAESETLVYEWRINDKVVDGSTSATASLTLQKGDTVSVTVRDAEGLVSKAATSDCVGTARPKVTTKCASTVVYGEDALFTAVGKDADGDSLTYAWTINGTVVEGATTSTLTAAVKAGDKVAVTATDPTGNTSASVTFDCTSGSRPKVQLVCPENLIYGKPAVWGATVTNEDGTKVTFTWAINGVLVEKATSSSATLTVQRGDEVEVDALSSVGISAAITGVSCIGTDVKDTSQSRAIPAVKNVAATRSAYTPSNVGNSLSYTGGNALKMAFFALGTAGVGALLILIARRRRTVD